MSDPVRPHRQQPTRLPRPWDSPGKNTEVGCHFLLQCMKVKSESEVAQLCPTLSDSRDCRPPGSSVRGIFQARVLEWGATAFSNNLPSWHLLTWGLEPPSTHSAQLNLRASQGALTLLTSGMRPTRYVLSLPLQPLLQSTIHHFLPQLLQSLQPDLICSLMHLTGTSVSHHVPGFISPPCPIITEVLGEFSRE